MIDKKATLKALKKCIGDLDSGTKITVEGHTAGSSGANNDFAKTLSTQRATEVAALLKELDVPGEEHRRGRRLRQLEAARQARHRSEEPRGGRHLLHHRVISPGGLWVVRVRLG